MGQTTNIEWTDATWNPIRGCSRVSEGCRNCYAESVAHRFSGAGQPYEGLAKDGRWTGKVVVVEKHLEDPLRWREPKRVFVNSMSDLFHDEVSNETIAAVFGIMAAAPKHTFQVLTKRPERMLSWFQWHQKQVKTHELAWEPWRVCEDAARDLVGDLSAIGCTQPWPLPNVWLGVSVENQKAADERIPLLLQVPSAVRFLSCEPLLGPVDASRYMWPVCASWPAPHRSPEEAQDAGAEVTYHRQALVSANARFIDWVIAGGESGPNARPMHPDWARTLRDQCVAAGVPFFFKQWGEWAPGECTPPTGAFARADWFDGRWEFGHEPEPTGDELVDDEPDVYRVGKKAAGRLLDGRTWDEFPAEVR